MGHIPKVETTTLNIINFKESLNNYNNSSTFDKEKWIYIPNFYTDYRYILGIKGKNPLIVIGINTSTATPFKLDNTLKSIERISSYNNFDSFIMLIFILKELLTHVLWIIFLMNFFIKKI